MVEGFPDRLSQFIENKQLIAGALADRLGIQRSTLSHLFAGRNKPGFDFLQKLSDEFPELNLNWMVTGTGDMFFDKNSSLAPVIEQEKEEPLPGEKPQPKFMETSPVDLFSLSQPPVEPARDTIKPEEPYREKPVQQVSTAKKAVKVILLYNDGSFEEFQPSAF